MRMPPTCTRNSEMATRENSAEISKSDMEKGSPSGGSRELFEGDGYSSVDSEEWESDLDETLDHHELPGSGGQDGRGRDVPLEEAGFERLFGLSELEHRKELHSQEVRCCAWHSRRIHYFTRNTTLLQIVPIALR